MAVAKMEDGSKVFGRHAYKMGPSPFLKKTASAV